MKTKEELLKDWEVDVKRQAGVHKPTGIRISGIIGENDKISKMCLSGNFDNWCDEQENQGKNQKEIHHIICRLKEELEVLLEDSPLQTPTEQYLNLLEDLGTSPEKMAKIRQMIEDAGGKTTAEILRYILKGK